MYALDDFWSYLDRLIAESTLVIDRPKGSHHPRYPDLVYPLDYGYLEGGTAMDGGGIDLWIGSQAERTLQAVILTVDLKKRDAEIKILLACSEAENQIVLNFLNDHDLRATLLRRPGSLLSWMRERRSVRRFRDQEVPADALQQILETASWAPSAHNRQPWRFVVLKSPQAKTNLAQGMGADFLHALLADGLPAEEAQAQVERSRQRIEQAPVVVLVCLDAAEGDPYADSARQAAEVWMGVQSVAMAGQNLLLAAHACGLGGVWICAPLFAAAAVRRSLDLPEAWQPQGMVLLGYAQSVPAARARRPLSDVVVFIEK